MQIMKFFTYAHLPAHLRQISEPICRLAETMNAQLEPGAELAAGLRKLLEAKDCLVRAGLKQSDHGLRAGRHGGHQEAVDGLPFDHWLATSACVDASVIAELASGR